MATDMYVVEPASCENVQAPRQNERSSAEVQGPSCTLPDTALGNNLRTVSAKNDELQTLRALMPLTAAALH